MDTQSHNNTGSHIAGDAGAGSGNAGSGDAGAGSHDAGAGSHDAGAGSHDAGAGSGNAGSGNAGAGSHDAGAGSHATATATATDAKAGIPALRFPDFADAPPWQSHTLGEIGEIIRGASPRPKGDPRYYGGDIPRLMGTDVTRDGKYVIPVKDFLTKEGAERSRFLPKGTLTIVCSGTVGVPSILGIDCCIHDGFLALINLNRDIDVEFLFYLLSSLQKDFNNSATHGGVFINLTTTILRSFRVLVPSLAEQERVAAALTAVDDKVEALTQKVDLLETWKRGLMQQLFPQHTHRHNTLNATSTASHANATATATATTATDAKAGIPALRFPDFADAPPWQSHTLGEIFTSLRGSGLSKSDVTANGQNKCILYGELYTEYSEAITSVISTTNITSKVRSKPNDLLFPSSTTTTALDLASASCLSLGNVLIGGDIIILRGKKIDISSLFFAYYLTHVKKFDIAKYGQGVTIVHLYFDHFKKVRVLVPSLAEQERVAAALTSVDDKIAGTREKLAATKQLKTYLLQNLFPN